MLDQRDSVQIEKSDGKLPKSSPVFDELPITYGTVPDEPHPLTIPVVTEPAVTFPIRLLPVISPQMPFE